MKISYAAVFTVVTAFADLARGQGFKIASMTWLGRGCPSGSVSLSTDPIGKSSVLTFSAFTTELPGNGTKDCSLHYDIRDIPESQRVVFNSATARGYLSLSKESSVYYRTMGYWSSDAMARFTIDKEQAGEVADDVFQLGPLELSASDKAKYGSPCTALGSASGGSAIFNLNLAVTLAGSNAKADIDSLDVSLGLAPC